MEIFIGRNELFLLFIVVLYLLHNFLEFLIREHILLNLILNTLKILILKIYLFLKTSEYILEFFFIRRFNTFFFLSESWDSLLFVVLFFSLLFPVFGPLSSWFLVLSLFSDSLIDLRIKGLVMMTQLVGMFALYSHL